MNSPIFNPHPFISAFPAVMLVQAVILETIARWYKPTIEKAVFYALIAAFVSTVGAFFSGYLAGSTASQYFTVPDDIIAAHHNMGRLLLFLVTAMPVLHYIRKDRRWLDWLYLSALILSLSLVLITGHLGADLIFKHGAGVYPGNLSN